MRTAKAEMWLKFIRGGEELSTELILQAVGETVEEEGTHLNQTACVLMSMYDATGHRNLFVQRKMISVSILSI